MENIIKELKEYADLSMDETGEATHTLIELWNQRDYLLDTFIVELEKMIRSQLLFYKNNSTITTRKETRSYLIKDLEWY